MRPAYSCRYESTVALKELNRRRSKRSPPWRILWRTNDVFKGGKRLWIDFKCGINL